MQTPFTAKMLYTIFHDAILLIVPLSIQIKKALFFFFFFFLNETINIIEFLFNFDLFTLKDLWIFDNTLYDMKRFVPSWPNECHNKLSIISNR